MANDPKKSKLVDVRVFFDNTDLLSFLELPQSERRRAFIKKRKQQLKDVLNSFVIENVKHGKGRAKAPNGLRGLFLLKDLKRLQARKDLIVVPYQNRRRVSVRKVDTYHGLIRITDSTEGVRSRSHFYMTVAVKAKNVIAAIEQVNAIANGYNEVTLDGEFRKVVSTATVLLVEFCETDWGDKKPDHLVMIRTVQTSSKSIHLKTLVEQAVPNFQELADGNETHGANGI